MHACVGQHMEWINWSTYRINRSWNHVPTQFTGSLWMSYDVYRVESWSGECRMHVWSKHIEVTNIICTLPIQYISLVLYQYSRAGGSSTPNGPSAYGFAKNPWPVLHTGSSIAAGAVAPLTAWAGMARTRFYGSCRSCPPPPHKPQGGISMRLYQWCRCCFPTGLPIMPRVGGSIFIGHRCTGVGAPPFSCQEWVGTTWGSMIGHRCWCCCPPFMPWYRGPAIVIVGQWLSISVSCSFPVLGRANSDRSNLLRHLRHRQNAHRFHRNSPQPVLSSLNGLQYTV